MTSGLVLLAHWSVCRKLNRVSSVQFSSVMSLSTRLWTISYRLSWTIQYRDVSIEVCFSFKGTAIIITIVLLLMGVYNCYEKHGRCSSSFVLLDCHVNE